MKLNHNDPVKTEQEIDAALKLLNETQPPAAMTSRIHRDLEAAVTAAELARPGRSFPGWSLWIPTTVVAIAAILLVVYSQAHWMQQKQVPAVQTATMAATDSVLPDHTILQPAPASAASLERKELVSAHRDRHRRNHTQYRHVANLLDYPLTEQEKLLVRFAQTASPADLQTLNPEYQAKIEAQQDAEFAVYLKSGDSSNTLERAETN